MTASAHRFEEEFRAFAAEDARNPPPDEPVLFYGSSSIRLWTTLRHDFPDLPVLNRGFGGSTLAECATHCREIVLPYAPRQIHLYAGDNDLDGGSPPEDVLASFRVLLARVREGLGDVPLTMISIKPSPARFWNLRNISRANVLLEEYIAGQPHTSFLNVYPLMLDIRQQPRRELYVSDGLHLSREGYRLWSRALHAHGPG